MGEFQSKSISGGMDAPNWHAPAINSHLINELTEECHFGKEEGQRADNPDTHHISRRLSEDYSRKTSNGWPSKGADLFNRNVELKQMSFLDSTFEIEESGSQFSAIQHDVTPAIPASHGDSIFDLGSALLILESTILADDFHFDVHGIPGNQSYIPMITFFSTQCLSQATLRTGWRIPPRTGAHENQSGG